LRVPAGPNVRDDGGVYAGAEVSIYYDPMISKLAAWGRTRDEAIGRMRRALAEYSVGGIKTTLPFFREIMRDAEFIAGQLDTGFIERFNERRAAAKETAREEDVDTSADITRRDIAIITAALAASQHVPATEDGEQPVAQTPSQWRIAGRIAQHRSRELF
jgi:acetyl-CoA carboxylase biotin carboxylase subunit